jgi:hypothetical protein
MPSPLLRAIALLQRYPIPLLLPAVVIAAAHMGINHTLASLPLSKFGHFVMTIAVMLINFSLTCLFFLCVANYTVRSESNGEHPEVSSLLDSLEYPGYGKLLVGLLTRFAVTLIVAGASSIVLVAFVFGAFKASAHHSVPRSVSGQAYLWVAMVFGILILSRWMLAIPLFVQSRGLLRSPFESSVKAIRGRRSFPIVFTLLLQAISYTFIRMTSPLHPHLSEGVARYVPHLLEIIAAHGFAAVLWTYWMIVMTMLAMQLQKVDEPLRVLPLAPA